MSRFREQGLFGRLRAECLPEWEAYRDTRSRRDSRTGRCRRSGFAPT